MMVFLDRGCANACSYWVIFILASGILGLSNIFYFAEVPMMKIDLQGFCTGCL